MYSFHSFEPVHCFILGSNCCFLTFIQVSQEIGKVVSGMYTDPFSVLTCVYVHRFIYMVFYWCKKRPFSSQQPFSLSAYSMNDQPGIECSASPISYNFATCFNNILFTAYKETVCLNIYFLSLWHENYKRVAFIDTYFFNNTLDFQNENLLIILRSETSKAKVKRKSQRFIFQRIMRGIR